jgi:hypothetical protein
MDFVENNSQIDYQKDILLIVNGYIKVLKTFKVKGEEMPVLMKFAGETDLMSPVGVDTVVGGVIETSFEFLVIRIKHERILEIIESKKMMNKMDIIKLLSGSSLMNQWGDREVIAFRFFQRAQQKTYRPEQKLFRMYTLADKIALILKGEVLIRRSINFSERMATVKKMSRGMFLAVDECMQAKSIEWEGVAEHYVDVLEVRVEDLEKDDLGAVMAENYLKNTENVIKISVKDQHQKDVFWTKMKNEIVLNEKKARYKEKTGFRLRVRPFSLEKPKKPGKTQLPALKMQLPYRKQMKSMLEKTNEIAVTGVDFNIS